MVGFFGFRPDVILWGVRGAIFAVFRRDFAENSPFRCKYRLKDALFGCAISVALVE